MIEETEFKKSIEANIKSYQDELLITPKDSSMVNILLKQIEALQKVKADVLLGRDGIVISAEETEDAYDWLQKKIILHQI